MTQSVEQKIIAPANSGEAAEALQAANAENIPVGFIGGGTKQEAGNLGKAPGLQISTRQLNELIAYQPEDLTITIGAGMEFDRLQAILKEHGQCLPLDPPHLTRATLGGIMAANPSGPKRLLYGTARDLLIGCEFVLANGHIGRSGGRVVKNVAGYDLHKLMIGSFGTLGLLTEVTFKVLPLPQHGQWAAALFDKAEDALQAARQAVRSNSNPAALEVLNATAQSQIGEFSGLNLTQAPYVLFFAAEGVAVAVKDQLNALTELSRKAGAREVIPIESKEENTTLWQALRDLPAQPAYNLRLRWSATLKGLPFALKSAEQLAEKLSLKAALQVRAGTGLIYLYANLNDAAVEQTAQLLETARHEAQKREGALVIEATPAGLKAKIDVWGDAGDAFAAMQALKNKLDPQGILNPGRFLKGF